MSKKDPKKLAKKLAFSGKDHDQIVKILENHQDNFSEEELASAFLKLDDYLVGYQLASQAKSKGFNQLLVGMLLFTIGASVTLVSWLADGDRYLLAYGAILGGAWIGKEGYKIYQMPLEKLVPRINRFGR